MKDAFNGVTEVRRGPAKGENESGVQNLKSLKGLKVARIGEQSVVPISEILEAAQARGGFFFCLACVHVLVHRRERTGSFVNVSSNHVNQCPPTKSRHKKAASN